MTAAPTTEPKPAVTRLWVALQKLTRLRDGYTRDAAADGRLLAARAMAALAAEIEALTAEVLAEAEVAAQAEVPMPAAAPGADAAGAA